MKGLEGVAGKADLCTFINPQYPGKNPSQGKETVRQNAGERSLNHSVGNPGTY